MWSMTLWGRKITNDLEKSMVLACTPRLQSARQCTELTQLKTAESRQCRRRNRSTPERQSEPWGGGSVKYSRAGVCLRLNGFLFLSLFPLWSGDFQAELLKKLLFKMFFSLRISLKCITHNQTQEKQVQCKKVHIQTGSTTVHSCLQFHTGSNTARKKGRRRLLK